MDEIVKQAMAKWPNVPHCYGWLGLDAVRAARAGGGCSSAAGVVRQLMPGSQRLRQYGR